MPENIQKRLQEAERLLAEAETSTASDFASQLAKESFASHVEELRKIANRVIESAFVEVLDFRIKGPRFAFGSVPLEIVADFAAEMRRIVGYTCLRVIEGGIQKKRVPSDLYSGLNLRLSGLEAGSSRMTITADSNVELFGESLAADAISRIIKVFDSATDRQNFLQAVSEIGPLAARRLKRLTSAMVALEVDLGIQWTSRGSMLSDYSANRNRVASLAQALNTTTVREDEKTTIEGFVELLSTNRRINIRDFDGNLKRISYPRKLIDQVSGLRLGDAIRAEILQTTAIYQYTGEQQSFLELVKILPNR